MTIYEKKRYAVVVNVFVAQNPSKIIEEELILAVTNSFKRCFLLSDIAFSLKRDVEKKIYEPVNLKPQRSP